MNSPEMLRNLASLVSMVTSALALLISVLTLGWTIYRDALRKPRFGVTVGVRRLIMHNQARTPSFVALDIVNLGPGANRIVSTILRKSWFRRKVRERATGLAYVQPNHGHPAASYKGERLESGDTALFVFPFATTEAAGVKPFLAENFVQIGIVDSFGRLHWASRKQYRAVREAFERQTSTPFSPDAPDPLSTE